MTDLSRVLTVYQQYVEARNALLEELNLKSNRDPLSEFSEWLVAALTGGSLAASRVQPDWDVQTPDGAKIQVKYLANPAGRWINEHEIRVNDNMDAYAIVFYEALLPSAIIIFPARNLQAVGQQLNKKHPNLEATLQFTQANYRQIINSAANFTSLGVRIFTAPHWTAL